MKRYHFSLLILLFCRVSAAQHWEQLGKGFYELKGGPIRAVYADSSGYVYAGSGNLHENFTLGKFFKCTAKSVEEPKNFPFHGKEIVITHIIGDNKSTMYVAGFYINDTYRRGKYHAINLPFVVKYNGKTWRTILDDTGDAGMIESICMDSSGNLYATGSCFIKDFYYYLAKWDGKIWRPVMIDKKTLFTIGEGACICTGPHGNIYIEDYPEGYHGYNIMKWDGKRLEVLGDTNNALNANGRIHSICCDKDGLVYAAGDFTNQYRKNYVAVWDGKSWLELGGENSLQANKEISVLCTDNKGNLYAAGHFTNKDKKCYVAHWNEENWSELGGLNKLNANNSIMSLSVDLFGNVYAAGHFSVAKRIRYVAVFRK